MASTLKNVMYDFAALWLRMGLGGMILFGHGLGKVEVLLANGEIEFPALFGLPAIVSLALAAAAEFLGGALLVAGLWTRLASLALAATMGVAAFVHHAPDAFFAMEAQGASKEFALVYLLGFVATLILGGGRFSLDNLFFRPKRTPGRYH